MLENKRTLVIGATPNPARYANLAVNMLLQHQHEVIPFGIKKGEIAGLTILNEWPQGEQVHTITLYINPQIQKDFYQKIIAMKPLRIIFNPGTENPELENLAVQNGIETIEACTLVLLRTQQF